MDEKYLSELWNWTNSQDPTFKDRYTFDSWSKKLKSNEGYKKQFYGWVSGIDETFEERRPYNVWSEMVSTDKKKEESALFSREGGTLSATPETEPQKPSASFVKGKVKTPSTFNKNIEDSDFKKHQDLYRSAKKAIESGDRQAFLQNKKGLDDLRNSYGSVMSNDANLSEDYNLLNTLSEEKFKKEKQKEIRFIQEEEKVPFKETKKKQLEKSIEGYESDVKYTPEERVTMLEIQRDLLESVDYEGIDGEVSQEYSTYSMKPMRTKIGMLSVPQVEGPANDAIKMAVDELVAAGKEPNKEEVLQRASEIRKEEVKNKREYEAIDDKYKFSSIIGKLEDQEQKAQALESIKKKRESHAEMFKSKVSQLEAFEGQVKQYEELAKEQGGLSDIQKTEALDVFNKYKRLASDITKNYSNIENDTENIGDFDAELDAFKRNHTYLTSASVKSIATLEKIGAGFVENVGMLNNIMYDLTGDVDFYLKANDLLVAGKGISESAQGMLDGVSKSKQLEDVKDAGDAIEWAGALMVENTPQILINVLTNGQAIPFLAASAAGEKYMEIYGDDKYSNLQKYAASILVGAGTAVSEKLELAAFNKLWPSKRLAKAAIEKTGREAFEKSLSEGVKKGISDVFSKSKKALAGVNQEGVSEVADQLSRNLVDKYVLDREDVSITDGLGEAYLSGAVVGAGLGAAPHVFSSIVRPFVNDPNKDILKNVNKIQKLNESLAAADDKMKPIIQERIDQLRGRNEEIIQKAVNSFDSLSPSEVKEAIKIYEDITSLKKEYSEIKEDTTIPPDVKEALLESVFTKYNSLVERRLQILKKAEENAVQEQTTSEVPVQPETAVGEEVAEGTPEAESEVVTEEGKEEVAKKYADDLKETKDSDPEQYWSVDSVSEEAAKEGTVITDEDGGVVVSKEGDIKGLFKRVSSKAKGVAQKLLQKAIDAGGMKLDNFDTYLTPIYKKAGFRVVSRIPFNEEYAPDGWNKEKHGTPDVVAMVYDPNNELDIEERTFDDYDEAMAYRDSYVEQARAETGQQQTLAAEQGAPTTIEGTGLRENIKKSIAKVFKSFDTKSFKNAKEMAAYAKAKFNEETGTTDSARIFVGSDGKVEVLVNEELADDTALGHEVWHALLLKAFGDNQAKFAEFRGAIDKTLRQNGYEDIADALDEFSSQYTEEGEVPAEEYLAQLGGLMTSANIDLKNLTPAQKSLLQQIKDIINDFAIQLTGQPVFLKEATPETILDFMSTMSDMMAKGEDISGFFDGGKKTSKTRAQKAAIEILDGPKFDNKLKEDVASYLNSLRDSELPPNSSREQLMERFINNVYEEVGYYLFSKPDARSAGLTWYIEDMVEFENKVKVILPELSNENQYKLFLSILAFTSSGTNPNQNLSYAYNLWNNSNDPKNFEFSKDWGDKKLSFVDKKGKAVASGVIVKETAREYTVELVDSLGRPEVDSKGNKKYEKVSKASMKPGYPKSTGYTNRGKIIVGQLEKLEKLYADLKSIDAVVKWLETPHPIAELRKYNEAVPDVNGKGPGKTNKKYDPSKNADGERNGAFIFGEKIGSFYQNMIGIGETITMDLWWSRTWNRYMGTMINTTSGNKEIQEVPRSDRERNIMREAVKMVAEDLNLQVSELQAAIWYFEQELWTKSGNASPSYSYVTAIDELTEKLKVDEETRTKLRAAEADLTEAEKRRKNAAERAAAVVASKGGEIPKVEVTTRAQKAQPTEATENDFVLPFGKYKGQWYSTTPKNYKEFLLKQDWFDPRKYFAKPDTETRAQKAQPQTIPGYDRMIGEAKSIVEKSRKRRVSADQIAENVINYIQGSAVYERADDLQREQIIRDARKDLGLRQRSAPSVDKLLGKIKDIKKVTVTEKSALKELLKAEAAGARTAVQARSQAAKALNDMLKALEKKGSVTTAQVRAIMTRYSKVNFFSSSSMDNFVNYMAKVFSDAEYSDKLKTASKTANAIRRLSKSDTVQAGTKAVAKKFLEIDPRLVEDIDKYLEFAKALNDAVRTSMAINVDGDFEVLLKKAIDYNEFQDYMDAQIAAQEEYIKNQLAEIHKDLVDSGAIDASMSLADMKAIIDAINYENEDSLPSEEKERMIRAYLGSVMDSYAGLIDYMLENSMDPFSLELISISDKDRQTVSRFMKMDLNKLSLKEAYSVVEAIENFIVNKNVDNMGAVLAGYEGNIEAESMKKQGTKARPIRSFFTKKFGRVWAEQIEQLQITMERMFGGIEKATEIMRRSGVLDISQGKTKAVMQSEKIINKYTEKFGKIKDFNSAENIFERKIISFMTRTINGSDIQKSIEFERRKRIIDETITAMENGSETEVRDAAIARDIYDKVLKDAKTPNEVTSKSKDFNNEAVKFWIDEFSNIFDELQSVSRSVYNTILERDVNYTPDRFKRFEGIEEVIDITGSSFAANNESYDTKKSGTLMANNRIKTLGKDPKRVLSFDFDTDMSNAMMNALIDINTAYAIRKTKSFYESESFSKMVPSKDDRELIRRRIKAFITKTKRKEYVPQSELAQSMKAVNLMSQIAVGRALGSLAQVPKQTISVMANTMINSDGKLSFIDVINAKEFIDNSGYSIALRGIASNADVQTINKMLERQSESTAQEIQRGLNKAAEMWLNSFIARPDVWAARLSWITYYKESLRKQGIDADNIDWSTHEINQKAGDYAQAQVNRQQNYSDSDFAGELLGSKDPMKAYIRKVLFPYMTFVFNQKSRQMADIAILSNKTSSKADKSKARRSLYGLVAEMATYSLVGYFIKEVYASVVNALTGGDDDEEDKDKRLKNHIKYSAKTMINDLLSPIPNITDTPIDLAINKIMKISGLDEDVFSIPEDKGKSLAEVAVGPSSIVLEGMVNLERMSYAALTGTAVGEYMGKSYERELSKENQDLMKYVTVVYTAYLVGAVPADMGRLSEQVYRKLLKDSKKKKGSGSGSIKTSIDTKIK